MGTPLWEWPFGARVRVGWRPWSRRRRGGRLWYATESWGDNETYPGAAALEDVARAVAGGGGAATAGRWGAAGAAAASAAAARLAVVQLALAAVEGRLAPAVRRSAAAAAAEYVKASGCRVEEAAALTAAVELTSGEPSPALATALDAAARAAAAEGFRGGAASLWRAAYRMARRRRWQAEAALAAHGMEELARASGSSAAARLWKARAQRHSMRASG